MIFDADLSKPTSHGWPSLQFFHLFLLSLLRGCQTFHKKPCSGNCKWNCKRYNWEIGRFSRFLFWTLSNLISDPLVFVWLIYQIPFLRKMRGCTRATLGSLSSFCKSKAFPVGLKRSRIFASLLHNLSKYLSRLSLQPWVSRCARDSHNCSVIAWQGSLILLAISLSEI